jgi:hypothetical protein
MKRTQKEIKELIDNNIDKIKELYDNGKSFSEIGRIYNVDHTVISRHIRKFYNDIKDRRHDECHKNEYHCLNCGNEIKYGSTKSNKFCSIKCQKDYTHKEYIKRWKDGLEDGMRGKYSISDHIRKYLLDKYNNSCQICEWGKENPYTGKIPLEIHHIDGNYKNNKEENLQILCPNCHSLTNTYKSSNKTGFARKDERKSRRKKYI